MIKFTIVDMVMTIVKTKIHFVYLSILSDYFS